jgi:general secretion pathway protein H
MGEPRPSPIGKYEAARGYTLVELLVVLAVMGLLLLAAPALISAMRPGVEAKTAAETLANDLRAARTAAVAENSETWVVLNADAKRYTIEPYGMTHELPKSLAFELRGNRGENVGTRAEFRFFPDGSSTGGSIQITASGGRKHWIIDHWLTGRITVDE